MKKFTIDRKTWYRGKGSSDSMLLNKDGLKCCLGFYALACGLTEKQLLGVTAPAELSGGKINLPDEMQWLLLQSLVLYSPNYRGNSASCKDAITINDDEALPEPAREARLTQFFKEQGIEVEFAN